MRMAGKHFKVYVKASLLHERRWYFYLPQIRMPDNNFQVLAVVNNETHDESQIKKNVPPRYRSLFSLGWQHGLLVCINIAVIFVMAYNPNVVVHIMVIVKQVSVFLCSAREKQILRCFISSHFWWYFSTDKNARQAFQEDVTASLLNAHGSLSLDRSGCWTQICKFMHCLRF